MKLGHLEVVSLLAFSLALPLGCSDAGTPSDPIGSDPAAIEGDEPSGGDDEDDCDDCDDEDDGDCDDDDGDDDGDDGDEDDEDDGDEDDEDDGDEDDEDDDCDCDDDDDGDEDDDDGDGEDEDEDEDKKSKERMTGGGSIFTGETDIGAAIDTRITHGFTLHCDASDEPNNLQITIHGDETISVHLTQLDAAECTDDPAIAPEPPSAPFDTYQGAGIASYDGVDGYAVEWIFTDAGEPGGTDGVVSLVIVDPDGNEVLNVGSPGHSLDQGNHQAHK